MCATPPQQTFPPVYLVSVRSPPSPYVRAVSLPKGASLRVLTQAWLCFRTPHIRDPCSMTHPDILGEGLPVLWLVLACHRRQPHDHAVDQSLRPISTHSKCQGLHTSAGIFVPILVSGTALWLPRDLLSLEKSYHLYQIHSKQRNHFSPCDPEDPQAVQ